MSNFLRKIYEEETGLPPIEEIVESSEDKLVLKKCGTMQYVDWLEKRIRNLEEALLDKSMSIYKNKKT